MGPVSSPVHCLALAFATLTISRPFPYNLLRCRGCPIQQSSSPAVQPTQLATRSSQPALALALWVPAGPNFVCPKYPTSPAGDSHQTSQPDRQTTRNPQSTPLSTSHPAPALHLVKNQRTYQSIHPLPQRPSQSEVPVRPHCGPVLHLANLVRTDLAFQTCCAFFACTTCTLKTYALVQEGIPDLRQLNSPGPPTTTTAATTTTTLRPKGQRQPSSRP